MMPEPSEGRRTSVISVALAFRHKLLCAGLERLINDQPDMDVVAAVSSGLQALGVIQDQSPNELLFNNSLGDMDCFQLLQRVNDLDGLTRVLYVTSQDSPLLALRLMRSGARGILHKSAPPRQLIEAIFHVAQGEVYIPADLESEMMAHYVSPDSARSEVDRLTNREFQVLCLLAKGFVNREIAEQLSISIKTVDTYRNHLLKKLGLRNNVELAHFAIRNGCISMEDVTG